VTVTPTHRSTAFDEQTLGDPKGDVPPWEEFVVVPETSEARSRDESGGDGEAREPRWWRVVRLQLLGQVVLTATALLGVVCIVATIAALAFDIRPVVFRSGSMAPAIDTGALAISRTVPATEIAVGDIVTVRTGGGVNVTHRVNSMRLDGDAATLVLKGDANAVPDDRAYVVTSASRVLLDIPHLGYGVTAMSSTIGIFVGGLLVGAILLVALRPRGPGRRRGTRANRGQGVDPRATVTALALVVVVGAGGLAGARPTSAYYTDTAGLQGGTFSRQAAAQPPNAPVVTSCSRSGNSITLTWTASPNPTTFEIRYTDPATPTEPAFSGTLRTRTTNAANFNNKNGQVWIVAINAAGTSPQSNHYAYSGNGSNAVCNPA
jgi:signal peptidase I